MMLSAGELLFELLTRLCDVEDNANPGVIAKASSICSLL
jgi:hypothetical protein